jgi:hypothetical protein
MSFYSAAVELKLPMSWQGSDRRDRMSISKFADRRLSEATVQPSSWPLQERHTDGGFRAEPLLEEYIVRFMVIVKATKESEAGVLPSEKLLAEMGKYNEELVKAGIMLAGEGLQASSKGKRVRFQGKQRTVIDGPFTETKELIAGFWLWQVKSMEEAVEWVKRCPNPFEDGESEIEIRQVFEAEDFGAEYTPELRAQDEKLRQQMSKK